jgi:hypothetical protein
VNPRPPKKLTVPVTVRLDEDDERDLEILVRERSAQDNGRPTTQSLVIRDLIRERMAVLRARVSEEGDVGND